MWSLLAVVLSIAPVVPVAGPVVEGFRPPTCQRCSARRGVVIGSRPGDRVRAVGHGPITFAGQVGNFLYVVQTIAPDVRVTYGWLEGISGLVAGNIVSPGQSVGTAGTRTYLGVRVGETYVEPLRYLGFSGARLRGPGQVIVGHRAPSR